MDSCVGGIHSRRQSHLPWSSHAKACRELPFRAAASANLRAVRTGKEQLNSSGEAILII